MQLCSRTVEEVEAVTVSGVASVVKIVVVFYLWEPKSIKLTSAKTWFSCFFPIFFRSPGDAWGDC